MENKSEKVFVLDTNVILHDATCIQNFEDNEVVIPISALEELDQFKRGNEQIHYNARESVSYTHLTLPTICSV